MHRYLRAGRRGEFDGGGGRLGCRDLRLAEAAPARALAPALIKAYLRLGGFVGDGAFIDHSFNTTDVCLVMDTAQMSARHREFYIRKAGQG